MTHAEMTAGLVQLWIDVTDVDGRTHLEARWATPEMAAAAHAAHHAA